MLVASLKDMAEPSESAAPKKVGVAERNARMDQLRTQLAGVSLTGQLEPSHALLDLAVQQWENRCLKYVGPEKCHSREDEVQNAKPITTSLSLEGGKLKITELRQILRADKLAFAKMSEAGEDIRADASGALPLDQMIASILQDYDLIVALLPLGDLEGFSGKNRHGRGGRPGPYTDNAPYKGQNGKGRGYWGARGLDSWYNKGKNSPKGFQLPEGRSLLYHFQVRW